MNIHGTGPMWSAFRAILAIAIREHGITNAAKLLDVKRRTMTSWSRQLGAKPRQGPEITTDDIKSVFDFFENAGFFPSSPSCTAVFEPVVQIDSLPTIQEAIDLLCLGESRAALQLLMNLNGLKFELETPSETPPPEWIKLDEDEGIKLRREKMISNLIRSGESLEKVREEFNVDNDEILSALGG